MKFVFGKEGNLQVRDRAYVSGPGVSENILTRKKTKHGPSIGTTNCSYHFTVKRGVAEEWNDHNRWGSNDGKHVYARVLPPDAEEALDAHDAAIAEAEEVVKSLKAERQAFLAAQVVRGERVAVRHIEALPPKEPPREKTPEEKAEEAKELKKTQQFLGALNGMMHDALRKGG